MIKNKKNELRFPLLWRGLGRCLFSLALLSGVLGSGSSCYAQDTLSFSYTGAVQTFVVPGCVDTIHVKAWGAGGSGGGGDSYPGAVGGGGAYVKSSIAVTAGQIITVIVGGGAGPGGQCAGCAPGGSTGWGNGVVNGGSGGNAGCSGCSGGGGGGGGASAIYNGSTVLLVAGAGGGGSGGGQFSSGAIGGGGGQNGNVSPGSCSSPGIAGASASGNGGPGANKGGDGGGGGAGGGGYNGGTGGGVAGGCDCGACGGGGGNSFSTGINTIFINGNGQTGANNTDLDLPPGTVNGGNGSTKGGDGFVQLIFNGSPVVAFGFTKVCNHNATQFTDSTTNSTGSIVSRTWDFGDSSPLSTTQNPSHTYASGGSYNVTLIENNSVGCADTITKVVQVYYNPIAVFTQNDVCFGDSMLFTNNSTINSSTSITSNLWDFGDGGSTSSLQSPSHYYFPPGTYTASLLTTSADGCKDTATISVNTFDTPKSSFIFSNTCLFDSAKFTNTSLSPAMGSIASWSWDFGDSTPLNTSVWSLSHIFSAPGNYQITLITHSSNLGCPDTFQNTITVFPMPIADFDFANVCLNQAINFSDSSKVSSGSIVGRSWNFGDASPLSTLQNPSHTYASPGTYSVSLIVTTNNSCKDTIVQSVVVHPLPIALYSSSNVCDGTIVQFNNFSTIAATDTIQSWEWDFGDGSPFSNTPSTSHLYSAAGSYTVQLLIITNFGCPDSITKISVVNPNPSVVFTASDTVGCEPLCVSFQNLSFIATGNNAAILWSFGDNGPVSTSQNPNRCYINDSVFVPNSFNVILTVTSDSGCVSILPKNNYITAYANPNASFTVQPITTTIIDPVITVTDFSTGTYFWNWNYGEGSAPLNTSLQAPHTYADTGTYLITLITSTQYGCVDTAHETIIVDPEFVFYIPNAFSPDNDGLNDSFIGKGVFVKDFKMTIFDRWGNLIFFSDDKNKPWDGKANHGNEIAEADIYIYVIEIKDIKNKKHSYKGTVGLIK